MNFLTNLVHFRYGIAVVQEKSLPATQKPLRAGVWLGWQDLNLRNDGVKVRCLTPWLQPNVKHGIAATGIFGVEDGIRTHGLQCHKLAL